MGNTHTNIKMERASTRQAAGDNPIYNLIDLDGGGKLVKLFTEALEINDFSELDRTIRQDLRQFFYYEAGFRKCMEVDLRVLLEARRSEFKDSNPVLQKANRKRQVYRLEEDITSSKETEKRFVCHKHNKRGNVGETLLHLCMLNRTDVHRSLAKFLLEIYPDLIYDCYLGREYYGENVLHLAIANGDDDMFEYFMNHISELQKRATITERGYLKALLNQRACGTFFLPKDQADSWVDDVTQETLTLNTSTNYEGSAYFGEYPVFFAACLGRQKMLQKLLDCPDVLLNVTDMNGCTLLHMLVIYQREELFDLIHEKAPQLLYVQNSQGLTPLTLAAKLGHIEMFDHISKNSRQAFWRYGNVSSAAYPLRHIDSIREEDGRIDTNSAMYHVVYGTKSNHTKMMDSVVGYILDEKWNYFGRWRLLRRAVLFLVYFIMALVAFSLRPTSDTSTTNFPVPYDNKSEHKNSTETDPCYLGNAQQSRNNIRLPLEVCVLVGTLIYLFLYVKEIRYQGLRTFGLTLWHCPPKMLFFVSNCMILLIVPGRTLCAHTYDDVMSVLVILTMTPYILFFLSGSEVIGTFVVMIYKMIRKDLLKFLCIYLIFVVGFSQSMYLVFRGVSDTVFSDPFDSIITLSVMSLGEFSDIYETFDTTEYPVVAKALFLVYMVLATLLMINLFIAMMTDTYTTVRHRWERGEWLKERGNIILLIEQTLDPEACKEVQRNYSSKICLSHKRFSQDTKRNSEQHGSENQTQRAFIYRWNHSQERTKCKVEQGQCKCLNKPKDFNHTHRTVSFDNKVDWSEV